MWKLILAAITGALLTACGGGGTSSSGPPPVVSLHAPGSGEVDATAPSVSVTFSEPMDAGSLAGGITVSRVGGSPVAGTVWGNNSVFFFNPLVPFPAAAVLQVTVSADVRSAAGARLGAPVSWSFTTAHWRELSAVAAPTARSGHTAVWTGSEMIVWGGTPTTLAGGRYAAATDSWRPTSASGAPVGRTGHTAVWTGSEMIVWGGVVSGVNVATGGRYDPATDTWRPVSIVGAPSARTGHAAVWTGTEMIVWGGADDLSGGRYDPATDTWRPTSLTGAPLITSLQATVWTGTRMAVWGGIYNPAPPPGGGGDGAGVVYTGDRSLNTGALYDPATDTWTATSTAGAAGPRVGHVLVWSGSELLVWGGRPYGGLGGSYDTGGRYDVASATWLPTAVAGAPAGRANAISAWTVSKLLLWSGEGRNDGALFDPATDSWAPVSGVGGNSAAQNGAASVWTGTELIVWGGIAGATGARFTP